MKLSNFILQNFKRNKLMVNKMFHSTFAKLFTKNEGN
jgi:hypothetical protein